MAIFHSLSPPSYELEDESLLFLSDVLPTAYWSVEHAGVKAGDTVIVLGCGPVGLMAQRFAWMKGAERVIAVDHLTYRMERAKQINRVETFDFTKHDDMGEHLKEITHGGAEVVIDCVGMDGKKSTLEYIEQKLKLQGGNAWSDPNIDESDPQMRHSPDNGCIRRQL